MKNSFRIKAFKNAILWGFMNVPFYRNRGYHCAQAAMKCALGVALPHRRFGYAELDMLTGHYLDEITYPVQIAAAFEDMEIEYTYFVKRDTFSIILDEELFLETTERLAGKSGKTILKRTNYLAVKKAAKRLVGSEHINERSERVSIGELQEFTNNAIPICLLNFDRFLGRENCFAGHYVVVTDVRNGSVTYHNTGPKGAGANMIATSKRFMEAWELCFFDYDTIVMDVSRGL